MRASALALVWVAPDRDPRSSRGFRSSTHRPDNGHADDPTILVIEDEVLIRLAICDHLRHCGYRVIEGSSAEDAQRVLRAAEPVELLFSDVDLGPGPSGLALARWVREHFPDVRILLASGVARLDEQTAALCDGFFDKPYAPERLEAEIRRLLIRAAGQAD